MTDDTTLDIRLLGPLELRVDRKPVDLGPAKVRTLFTALAVAAPQPVTSDVLADILWAEELPADPSASLHSYVSRLRRALGDARTRVISSRGSYRLDLRDDEVDARRAESWVARGQREIADGDAAEASTTLGDALRLYRGPPLDGFADEPFAQLAAQRWSELRAIAFERRSEADLALGRNEAVAAELESLVRVYPYREALWRLLIVALHGSGRHGEIEQTWRELCDVFRKNLDVEPSDETTSLVERLTTADEPPPSSAPTSPAPLARQSSSLPALLASARTGPIVGRRASVEELTGGLSDAVLVVGEAGIGKTRLVAEVAFRAQQAGHTVLAGGCREHTTLEYEPLARAIDSHLQGPELDALAAATPDTILQLGRIVPGLFARADLPEPPYVEAAGILPLVVPALRAVLDRAADGRGALLVVEDLHWADPPSQELIAELVHERPPGVGLLMTTRPEPLDDDQLVPRLLAERRLRAIRLKSLNEAAVAALASELSNVAVREDAAERLHRASGGNPFFAVELIRGGWIEAGDSAMATEGIEALVRQRVAKLDERALDVLDLLSVGGGSLPLEVLESCVSDPDAIDDAAEAGLLRETDPGTVTFTHLIVRDALLQTIGPSRRRRLHRTIGQAMAPTGRHDERSLVETARHLVEGGAQGDQGAAVTALRTAADLAVSRGAFGDAIQQLRDAIDVLGDPDGSTEESAALHIALGWTIRASGNRLRSLDLGRRAVNMAGADRDPTLLADAALLQAPFRPDPTAVPALRSALARLGSDDPARRARLLVELGWSLVDVDLSESDAVIFEGATLAERYNAFSATERALDHEWEQHALDSDPTERLRRGRDLARGAAAAGERVAAAHGHLHCAIAHLELGQRQELRDQIERVAHLANEVRTPALLARSAQLRAMWQHLNGHLTDAEAAANEVFLHMPGDPSFVPIYGGQIVAIRSEQGRLDGMAELIASDEVNREHQLARSAQAYVHAAFGRDELAGEFLHGLLDEGVDRIPRDMSWLATLATLADAAAILSDQAAADAVWEVLVPFEDRFVTFGYGALCWGHVERFLAPISLLRGDVDDARLRLVRSLTHHRRLGAVPFVARDLLALSAITADDDRAEALDQLRSAHDLATRHELLAVAWEAEDRIAALA